MDDRPLSERLREAMRGPHLHCTCINCETLAALRRLETIDATEPVAWIEEGRRSSQWLSGNSRWLTDNPMVAENWQRGGFKVVPLIPKPEADQ